MAIHLGNPGSEDGEQVVFEVHDKAQNVGHIALDWLKLGLTVQLIGQAAEKAAEVRQSLGKSDDYDGAPDLQALLVSTFQVSEFPDKHLKILSLQSPGKFRWDFAIPTNTRDRRGRPFHRAIAEELLEDARKTTGRPH